MLHEGSAVVMDNPTEEEEEEEVAGSKETQESIVQLTCCVFSVYA